MFAAHLTGARVVKAFNATLAADIIEHARPSGTPHRRAIPIAGDDDAKRAVAEFIDQIGFDVVDVGSLVDGRSIDPMDAGARFSMRTHCERPRLHANSTD
jgi:predicted dinucleotide-binding enzyme